MNIKTIDLKQFQKLSSHVKASGITPSSDCIKFGNGAIIKNAHSAFVSFDCEDSNENILVDEHALMGLVNATSSEFINIFLKGPKVILSDGRDKIPVPSVSIKDYSELPAYQGDKKGISVGFLESLGRAAGVCSAPQQIGNLYMYVHVGEDAICAGNGFMGVHFPIEEDYKMVIEKKIAATLSKFSFTAFAESQGHHFFFGDGFFMGFSKQEIGWADLKKVLSGGKERTFSIAASDILSYNSLAMYLSKDFGMVTMKNGEFEMDDTIREISHSRPAAGITLPEPFTYNAENMNKIVSALGVEELDFYVGDRAYYIKSTETKATAIIQKIHKP